MSQLQLQMRPDGTLVAVQPQAYEMGRGYSMRASGTPGGTSPMYGTGGFFGVCDVDPVLFNACVGPMGIERVLTWMGTTTQRDQYDALTYIGTSGYGQSGMCADCGKPTLRECVQSAPLGRVCQMTNEHAFDQLGLQMNANVPRITLFGSITDPAGNVIIPQGQPIPDMFTLELMAAAHNLRRQLGNNMWTGNPSANVGGYWEHPGLYLLINTGKVDHKTGIACPALDSIVRNYGSAVIGAAGAPNIVTELTSVLRSVRYRAMTATLNEDTMTTYLAMHPIHWDCIATAWACGYGLACQNYNITMNNDAMEIARLRDQFMSSMMLPIDGREYPVVLDNLIPLTTMPYGNNTAFCGHVSVLTTSIEGETVLWGEYQDFARTGGDTDQWFRSLFGSSPVAITDGGRFLYTATSYGGFCLDARVLAKRRVIARMPWLSGRLNNVCCVPTGFYPDVTGSGGLYEKAGGVSSKPYLGLYNEWFSGHPGR